MTISTARQNLEFAVRTVVAGLELLDIHPVKGFLPEQRKALWKEFDATARKWEPIFRTGTKKALDHDRREILAIVGEAKKMALRLKASVDWKKTLKQIEDYLEEAGDEFWRSTFVPLIEGIVTDQGEKWAARLGVEFDVQNLRSRAWFNQYMLQFSKPINQTTEREIAQIMARAQADGSSIPQIQNQLDAMFEREISGRLPDDPEYEWFTERVPPYRVEAIARTETIRSSNAGTTELFTEWGVKRHEWLSTKDDRTRSYAAGDDFDHVEADGQVVEIGTPFIVSGEDLEYPGDPSASPGNSINCRCTTIPVIEDGEELQPQEPEAGPEAGEQTTSFESRQQADNWGNAQDGLNPDIQSTEREILVDYKTGATYKDINAFLREGTGKDDWTPEISAIDGVLAKTSLPEDVITYRGMDASLFPRDNQEGAIFEDKGYWSTSIAKETGDKYARWAGEDGEKGLVVIEVPKGFNGLWMEPFWKDSGESELLLPRGTRAEIISDSMIDDVRVLNVRVLP